MHGDALLMLFLLSGRVCLSDGFQERTVVPLWCVVFPFKFHVLGRLCPAFRTELVEIHRETAPTAQLFAIFFSLTKHKQAFTV